MSTKDNKVTHYFIYLFFTLRVLKTYRPEETSLSEPTFSNSWAFAATLKNNFKMQVSLKSNHSIKSENHLVQSIIWGYQLTYPEIIS